jgi:hypothetical protein
VRQGNRQPDETVPGNRIVFEVLDHSQCEKAAEEGDSEGGMSNYLRNVAVLRRIQIERDNMEHPDYWDDDDEYCEDEDEN